MEVIEDLGSACATPAALVCLDAFFHYLHKSPEPRGQEFVRLIRERGLQLTCPLASYLRRVGAVEVTSPAWREHVRPEAGTVQVVVTSAGTRRPAPSRD